MTTTIDRELFDLLNRVHEEGLIDNARRATLYDQVTAGRTLRGLDAGRYDLRREFDERFQGEREIDFPGTTALYRDIAEHGVFRSLMIKGRIELHERRIYEEFEALLATLTPVDMVPATPFITPAPLSIAGRLALVNEVLEHGIDSKAVILNTHNDGLNDGVIEAATAVRIDRGLRFHSEFFAETQDLDNDLFVDILDHGVISEAEYTALTAQKPHAADIDRLRRHFQLGDYRDVLAEEAAAAPFEVTGRELIVALAKINGVVAKDEHTRLTRLIDAGASQKDDHARHVAEYEAFAAEFSGEADQNVEGWPRMVWHALEFGLASLAERDDTTLRASDEYIAGATADYDYDPDITLLQAMRAQRHDEFHAAATATFTATPRPMAATPFEVTGRELIVARARVNGVIAADEYKRLTRLAELGSRMTEKQIRQCAEYEAFVADFKDIADEKAEGLPYSAWHAISFGLAGEAERDESLRREAAIDRDRRVNDDDYDPGVTALDSMRAARHDQFLADAGATVTAPPRPTWQAPAAEPATEPPAPAPKVEGTVVALNEDIRTYRFATGDIELHDVRELIVRGSGTHRLRDAGGRLHVIAAGWLAITIVDKSQAWTV